MLDGDRLRVYFDPTTWNVRRDGLIYTDKGWLDGFQAILAKLHYPFLNTFVGYSEQGLQGHDYVDLDVDARFVSAFQVWAAATGRPR